MICSNKKQLSRLYCNIDEQFRVINEFHFRSFRTLKSIFHKQKCQILKISLERGPVESLELNGESIGNCYREKYCDVI